jgi:hypothetical protein
MPWASGGSAVNQASRREARLVCEVRSAGGCGSGTGLSLSGAAARCAGPSSPFEFGVGLGVNGLPRQAAGLQRTDRQATWRPADISDAVMGSIRPIRPVRRGRATRPRSGGQMQYAERPVKPATPVDARSPAATPFPRGHRPINPSTRRQGRGAIRGPAPPDLARRCRRLCATRAPHTAPTAYLYPNSARENPRSRDVRQA